MTRTEKGQISKKSAIARDTLSENCTPTGLGSMFTVIDLASQTGSVPSLPGNYPSFPQPRDKSLDKQTLEKVQYKYYIRRTKSNNLPVYNDLRHGGSLEMTTIHHVEGDPRVVNLPQCAFSTFYQDV